MYQEAIRILDGLFIATAVASAATWIWLLRTRVSKRLPLVEPQPRRRPFWTLAEFFVCFGLPIVVGLAGLRVGLQWMSPEAQGAIESGNLNTNFPAAQDQMVLIVINFAAMALALLSVLVWMNLVSRRYLMQYGFWPTLADVRLGVTAAFLVLPHLLLMNYLISKFIKYEHPVLDMFGPGMTWQVLAMQTALTVVLAPLYEEFTFRALLQGGAEQLARRMRLADHGAETNDQVQEPADDRILSAEVASASWWPVVISSVVFASLHLQHGGGAIPIFILALALGYLYRQTGRLWPGLIIHMTLNGLSMLTAALGVWMDR